MNSKEKFKPYFEKNWDIAVEKVKNKELDAFAAGITKDKKKYMVFSKKSILKIPYVLITKKDKEFDKDLSDIKNTTIAVLRNSTAEHLIKEKFPNVKIILFNKDIDGFEMIEKNLAEVSLYNAYTAKYYLDSEKFKNLKIAHKTKQNLELRIAIRKEFPSEAISIINKSLDEISQKEIAINKKFYNV